jgi:hypothetical protein
MKFLPNSPGVFSTERKILLSLRFFFINSAKTLAPQVLFSEQNIFDLK